MLQVITLVLGISLALQAAYMPYEYGHANWLEVLSLIVTISTLYFSLYFSFSLDEAPLVVVTVLVIVMNVCTMAIFLYALVRAHWYSGVQHLGLDCKVRCVMGRECHMQCFDSSAPKHSSRFVMDTVRGMEIA